MTNALAQNIQTTDGNTVAIDMMLQVASATEQSKIQEQNSFSNIINNLESRTQKAQSDFDKQAKVTNVSSINKKALGKKEAVDSKDVEKNIQNTKNISKEIERTPRKAQKKEIKESNVSQDAKTIEKENKNLETLNNQVTSDKNNSKKIEKTENLSDINNSSPVESSPVFSSDKKIIAEENTKEQIEATLNEIEVNVEELINSIPVISEDIKVEIKDLNETIENVENFENIDEIINKIESISSNLDNSTLNEEQKSEITNALNEIKNLLKDAKKVIEQPNEFKDLTVEIKEKISKLIDIQDKNIKESLATLAKQENEKEIIQPTKQENKVENETLNLEKITNEIKDVIKEIKDTVSNLDTEKVNKFSEKLTKTIENLEFSKEFQQVNEGNNIEKNLVEMLKNLKNLLEKEVETSDIQIEQKVVEADFSNENKIFETLEKLSSNDFKNIDLKDEKIIKETVDLLENINNESENQELSEEIKVEIKDLIQKINQKEISNDDLTQAIDILADDIKAQTQKTQTADLEIENVQNSTKENVKIETNLNQNLNQNSNQKQNQQNIASNETQEIEIDLNDLAQNDADFNEVKLQTNISKDTEIKQTDAKNIEQNLQKTLAINEMLDEMMIEVDIKTIPSQSGALSVTDEITKLAMGETNSLNSITTPTGSVTYDAVGTNVLIKNVANLTKTSQAQNLNAPSMEDVLNQVVNKITQLKDVNSQKLTMILRPNDLGRLSIELTSNQQGLTTQIMAQNEDVRAYIEKNIDSLRQQLSDAGVNVNSIQIKTAGSENSTTYDGNQNLTKDFEQENQNQQNNKDNKNNQQNNNNNDAKEILATISNYDMSFAKDFSSILNKSLNYNLN